VVSWVDHSDNRLHSRIQIQERGQDSEPIFETVSSVGKKELKAGRKNDSFYHSSPPFPPRPEKSCGGVREQFEDSLSGYFESIPLSADLDFSRLFLPSSLVSIPATNP
jgi:hypothetical protein